MKEVSSVKNPGSGRTRLLRRVILGVLLVAFAVAAYRGISFARDVRAHSMLSQNLDRGRDLYFVLYNYELETSKYPESLRTPEFQSRLDERLRRFIKECQVQYFVPSPESKADHLLLTFSTPRRRWGVWLDGHLNPVKSGPESK